MKNKISTLWWFTFILIYLEVLYKFFALHTLFSFNTIFMLPFLLIYIGFNSFITGLSSKELVNKIICYILSIGLCFYFLVQYVYFNFYLSFVTLYNMGMGAGQVFQFGDQIISTIFRHIFVVLLIILPVIILLVFNKYFTYQKNNKYRNYLNTLVLCSGLILTILNLNINKKDIYSNYNLFYNEYYPSLMINRFGITTNGLIDAYRYFTDYKEKYILEPSNNDKDYSKEEYNIIDINFDELLKNENNNEIKVMHKYFKNKIPTNKNKYTGIFKGKNLIFITAESLDDFAISKDLTPTLYKLTHEGFIFDNYYVPLFPVSTSDGEYMNTTGLLPKDSSWSLYLQSFNDTPYSLAHTFSKDNYKTFAYHNHKYDFYHRNLIYPKLGFDSYQACGNGLEEIINCNLFPESDQELIKNTLSNYINLDNYFAYYLTMSGHLRYTPKNDMAKKHWDLVKDLNYPNNYKAYLSQNIDLDRGLEYLLNVLEEKDELKDTVIVISPDHYPYGFQNSDLKKFAKNKLGLFKKYKSSLVIWNPEIKNTHIKKVTASIDIIPTLYNLFGIEYDSRLFIGNDIFSDSEGLAVLSNRSFKTDKVEYNALTNTYKFNAEVDLKYLEDKKKEVYSKFTMSAKILDNNYYGKLASYID